MVGDGDAFVSIPLLRRMTMNQSNYRHTTWNTPFIAQRADPYVFRQGEKWYFTASVPEYDRIALRAAFAGRSAKHA